MLPCVASVLVVRYYKLLQYPVLHDDGWCRLLTEARRPNMRAFGIFSFRTANNPAFLLPTRLGSRGGRDVLLHRWSHGNWKLWHPPLSISVWRSLTMSALIGLYYYYMYVSKLPVARLFKKPGILSPNHVSCLLSKNSVARLAWPACAVPHDKQWACEL